MMHINRNVVQSFKMTPLVNRMNPTNRAPKMKGP